MNNLIIDGLLCISVSDDDEIDYSVKPEFYDPDLDDKDEAWVHKRRKGRSSDAVLSCPACFTTLCLESQRYMQWTCILVKPLCTFSFHKQNGIFRCCFFISS